MSTRSRKSVENKQKITKNCENSWILLAKDALLQCNNFSIITLPHPASGKPSKYCISQGNIFEVVTYDEPYRSWFIGDTVKSDGSIQIITPINPLFLVLPRLKEQCMNRAVPIQDLLSEKGFDKIIDHMTKLELIGDLKGPADLKAYKYNETKTLNWLETRIRKLSTVLKEKNIHVTPGAASATFVGSCTNSDTVDDEFFLKYAHGLVSEYLQDDLIDHLEKRFNFKPELIETLGKKRKSEAHDIPENKKVKIEHNMEDKDDKGNILLLNTDQISNVIKKEVPLTGKQKARQKAASGTKTISSFFKKQ